VASQCQPCHTYLPQAQGTVSVGRGLVSCCLQTGQGFVITGVIILAPLRLCLLHQARHVPKLFHFANEELPSAGVVAADAL
jgi:hypothetical protein